MNRKLFLLIIFIIFSFTYIFISAETKSPIKHSYKIVSTEDISLKALVRPLSSYSPGEIKDLPMNIRKEYRIVVPTNISREELKSIFIQLVDDETSKNPDIDEIVIFAYDREDDVDGIYTFGKAIWCPSGKWGKVTSKIASTNDRASYKYSFDIMKKVGSVNALNKPTEREWKIYKAFDNALWEDPDAAEVVVARRVAKQFGISEDDLNRIYLKVVEYKMQ